jgi:putative transcriptional regulator
MSDRQYYGIVGQPPEKEPFQYTGCGLDNVYLLSGFKVENGPYGKSVAIQELDGLHAAIAHFLAVEKKILSGKELRFLRLQIGLTQAELAKLLGLSSQSVARWEKGHSNKGNPAAELLVRALYLDDSDEDLRLKKYLTDLSQKDSHVAETLVFEPTASGWRGDQRHVAVG